MNERPANFPRPQKKRLLPTRATSAAVSVAAAAASTLHLGVSSSSHAKEGEGKKREVKNALQGGKRRMLSAAARQAPTGRGGQARKRRSVVIQSIDGRKEAQFDTAR